ncbi:hypothetical protein Pla123a_34690 [Posidoniimonas polymericola]|uniref:Uncharacterized protein n=1 Tax=Posidoniimonas polymericola TaxID=2528002 RepID=A0A5C5YIE6_9BACT|nr:hypothetical protein [Posidoniimonas polymericola]TWT74645.1 hypothetical protein Pla123a_34690 [Posidoniimonas polymericola]
MKSESSLGRIPQPAPAADPLPLSAGVRVRCATGEELTPQQLEQIEALDDVIFAALDGNPAALDESARLYRQAAAQTHPAALDESREQYLKKAESIVADYRTQAGASLAKTFAALEILTLVAE